MLAHRGAVEVLRGLRRHARRLVRPCRPARCGVIGPNGAGKTTFFNLITGHLRPDSGRVSFEGRDMVGLPPHEICAAGHRPLVPAHQHLPRLTVFENVQVALLSHHGRQRGTCCAPGRAAPRRGARSCWTLVGLADQAERRCGELSYGNQKQLELAIALAIAAAPAAARRADRRHVAAETARPIALGARHREGARASPAVHRARHGRGVRHRRAHPVLHHGRLIADGDARRRCATTREVGASISGRTAMAEPAAAWRSRASTPPTG